MRSGVACMLVAACVAIVVIAAGIPAVQAGESAAAARERISINSGWRFHKGDPDGLTTRLDYDVRPEVRDKQGRQGRGCASRGGSKASQRHPAQAC